MGGDGLAERGVSNCASVRWDYVASQTLVTITLGAAAHQPTRYPTLKTESHTPHHSCSAQHCMCSTPAEAVALQLACTTSTPAKTLEPQLAPPCPPRRRRRRHRAARRQQELVLVRVTREPLAVRT